MIEIMFRACCDSCPHIDVDYETYGTGITTPTTMIGCKHMSVCGLYGNDIPEDPPKNVTVRGFHNADG